MDGLTISQAAEALGISVEAVRKRVQRGTLAAHKDDAGRWMVFPDAEPATEPDAAGPEPVAPETPPEPVGVPLDAVVDAQRDHIRSLEEQVARLSSIIERHDVLLLNALKDVQRALPPPPDENSGANTGESSEDDESPQKSWWQRFWGL